MIPPTSNPAIRLKNVEEYLVSQGYVCSGSYWVDCVKGGHNISFDRSASPPVPNSSFLRDPTLRPGHDNYFTIHMSDRYVETADDVATAVLASRSRIIKSRYI